MNLHLQLGRTDLRQLCVYGRLPGAKRTAVLEVAVLQRQAMHSAVDIEAVRARIHADLDSAYGS